MRLKRLRVENYRVLRELELDFERSTSPAPKGLQPGYALDFIVGVNGTGKTTALQFIARLFAHLYGGDQFSEAFELEYVLAGASGDVTVSVTNSSDENEAQERIFRYRINNDEQRGKLPSEFLPRYVVIYTTGSEKEWERALELEAVEESSSPQNPGNTAESSSARNPEKTEVFPGPKPDLRAYDENQLMGRWDERILFVRRDHLPLVALCGLLASRWPREHSESRPDQSRSDSEREESASKTMNEVLTDIGLEKALGFSLRLRYHQDLLDPGQWDTIQRIEKTADQIVVSGADRLLLFDIEQQSQKQPENSIFRCYPTPIDLFAHLQRLYEHRPFYEPPLQEVSIFFQRKGGPKSASSGDQSAMLVPYDWLSDGEQSFLARMALFAIFRSDNLLILLDEPEVHFNDVWKRQIVQKLDGFMRGFASHAILTTQSSIALSDVPAGDILVLHREGEYTSGEGYPPGLMTLGADPSDIMIHVFGTPSASGERSVRFIRERIGQCNTPEELEELSKQVAPGYWRYRIQLEAQSRRARSMNR